MNTGKQINVMVLLVFAAVIATAAYTLWDPSRASQAEDSQLERTVDRGAYLYSQNCRACHGDKGEGGAAANRLPEAFQLDRFDLQGRQKPDGPVVKESKDAAYRLIVNTLTCGRVGKYMPPWSIAQGGTLTDEQIAQLATFITEGTAWGTAQDFAIHGDHEFHLTGDISDGITLVDGISSTDTVLHLSSVASLGKGQRLQMFDTEDLSKAEIMLVTEKPDLEANTVTVERHLGTTKAASHAADTPVLKVPSPPSPPSITGSTGPVCGQRAQVAAPTPTSGAGASGTPTATSGGGGGAASGKITLVASNTLFDQTELSAQAGTITFEIDNQDAGLPHNLHIWKGTDTSGEDLGMTPLNVGPSQDTLELTLDAGDYYFQCDVHPTTMAGKLTVQ